MDFTQKENDFEGNTETSSGHLTHDNDEYGNTSGDDDDSEATLSAIEEMEDDIGEEENLSGLSAEDLFRLIMSDHQYLSNTFPKCFGHTREAEGDGEHVGPESPIPDAAAIQHFFLKAMNLASFEPIKDDELKLKYSACPNKCGLALPFDKLANRHNNNSCKNHGSDSNSEKGGNKSCRSSNISRSKDGADILVSSATQLEGMMPVKDATDKTIAQSQWTSECKAVFEKVQQASYLGCALTLLQRMWENYLGSSFDTIRQQEIQRARTVDFCNEVRQMIEDDGRYVCQVIEEMEPVTFTTDFVI